MVRPYSPSHLEGSSTSICRPGYCNSPVLVIKNVDVHQPTPLGISSDGVHARILVLSSFGSHPFYLHVQHC